MSYKSNINEYVLEHVQTAVFDLDRTLIKQDSLIEQLKVIFRVSKSEFFNSLLFLASQGRVLFKKKIFKFNESFDKNRRAVANIEVNKMVKKDYEAYKKNGIKVIVATASYELTAFKVLQKIKIFPDVLIATNKGKNLKGKIKLNALNPYVKNMTWVYYGDSKSDTPLFQSASFAYLVTPESINPLFDKNI
jgi:phosphoserine phosphatase